MSPSFFLVILQFFHDTTMIFLQRSCNFSNKNSHFKAYIKLKNAYSGVVLVGSAWQKFVLRYLQGIYCSAKPGRWLILWFLSTWSNKCIFMCGVGGLCRRLGRSFRCSSSKISVVPWWKSAQLILWISKITNKQR